MADLTPKEIVLADAEAIYIGNIFTVEADLILPLTGAKGSAVSWATDRPHIISEKGKVTRPREGAGNREVTLTATVTFEGETVTREFVATVLALKSKVKIVNVQTAKITSKKGAAVKLPGVVIVEKDDKTYSTAVVKWQNVPDFSTLEEGVYEISAEELSDCGIIPKAAVTIKNDYTERETCIPSPNVDFCDYGDVKITGGFFNENRVRAEEFLIAQNVDSLLYNFREAAGLDTLGASAMTGWDAPECLLKGHTTGHYLSAIALAFAGNTENSQKLKEKIDCLVDGLAECQDAMEKSGNFSYGFLSGYSEEQFDKLQEYVVYPKIWAPYYTLHKILSGLLDCYEYAHSEKALKVAEKIGIWTYNRLSKLPEEQLQKMWSMYIAGEFGGYNESLARLNKFIKNPQFVEAAKLFDNERLFLPMSLNIDTLGGIHANQHVPQIIGALEIFKRTDEKKYYDIARNFWHIVTGSHIYNIGGTGEGEMFRDADDIGKSLTEKTCESCVSYNMLKLTAMLFAYEPKSYYMDYFEKALYNHIAASQDQSGPHGGSTYFMPLLPGGKKRFDTNGNTCCHGTGLENHVKYQEAIFYTKDKTVYVNLYIPSVLSTEHGGLAITGDYLLDQKAVIKIEKEGFNDLRLRVPARFKTPPVILLNGGEVNYETNDGYAVIKGEFKLGDVIEAQFPFELVVEPTKDAPEIVSLYYGPLVMVALSDSDDFITLEKDFAEKMQKTGDLEFTLGDLKFIPNYYADKQKYHAYFKTI